MKLRIVKEPDGKRTLWVKDTLHREHRVPMQAHVTRQEIRKVAREMAEQAKTGKAPASG